MSQKININSFKELGTVKAKFEIEKAEPKKRMGKGRFDEAWQMIRKLQNLYPQTFNQDQPLPLAIGTAKEIRKQHPDLNLAVLRLALAIWTRRKKYLQAVALSENRHNLDGSIASKIQESEKDYSKLQLDKKSKRTD